LSGVPAAKLEAAEARLELMRRRLAEVHEAEKSLDPVAFRKAIMESKQLFKKTKNKRASDQVSEWEHRLKEVERLNAVEKCLAEKDFQGAEREIAQWKKLPPSKIYEENLKEKEAELKKTKFSTFLEKNLTRGDLNSVEALIKSREDTGLKGLNVDIIVKAKMRLKEAKHRAMMNSVQDTKMGRIESRN